MLEPTVVMASRKHELLGRPSYTVADVARYLSLPQATVRAWVAGTTTGTAPTKRKFARVVVPAKEVGTTPLLSFENLCEVHTLSLLRRKHNVTLGDVRKCVRFLEE